MWMNAIRATVAVQRYAWTPKAPGAVSADEAVCWMKMDAPVEVQAQACIYVYVLYRDE